MAVALAALLAGCSAVARAPDPGTPEFAAFRASRGYDCGLAVERARIAAGFGGEERRRFLAASAGYAVKSYRAPHACGAPEREEVRAELRRLARR
jgi:hypothetical protein